MILLFPHLAWHALTGHFLPGGSLPGLGRQVAALRLIQAGTWLLTAGLFLAWARRTGARLRPGRAAPPFLAWWWSVTLASVALDLGAAWGAIGGQWLAGGMPVALAGEATRLAAAVLTLMVVRRVDRDRNG